MGTDWNYKLGLIIPSWNTTMEYECCRMAPAGVSIHSSRIAHTDDSEESLLHTAEMGPEAALLLAHAKVNAICFGCTGASFLREGIDQEIIDKIEDATRIATTTTSTAIIEALDYLNLKSVAIATPYPDWINERLAEFLVHAGYAVVSQKGLNVDCPAFLPPASAYMVAKDANRREADGILISCTNFRSLEVIAQLEQDLGKPVISSNTATMWKLLQLAGVPEKVADGGQLFK
ncbi:MAG: aspartate/glutamate racemase family protein [Desulfobacterales bacterium]|nr:MAG: aspartate/glutamate racemase family protein [Desulfobacterales bacterium]